jgi:sulfite exporter TauE/SafE
MAAMMAAVFVASLLGSLHCAGMCGGLVAIAVSPSAACGGALLAVRSRFLLHVVYHAGRFGSYVALGATAGALGAAMQRGGALAGFQHSAGLVSGVLLIAFAMVGFLRAVGARFPGFAVPSAATRLLARLHAVAGRWSELPRSAAIGALSAFLPCGWLYMFVLAAAGTGNAAWGALVMAAFWAGSVPVLVGVGVGAQTLQHVLGRHLPVVMSLVLLALGVWTAAGRVVLPTFASPVAASLPAVSADPAAAKSLTPSQAPCCKHGH